MRHTTGTKSSRRHSAVTHMQRGTHYSTFRSAGSRLLGSTFLHETRVPRITDLAQIFRLRTRRMPQALSDGGADVEMEVSMIARDSRIDSDDEKPIAPKVHFVQQLAINRFNNLHARRRATCEVLAEISSGHVRSARRLHVQ